MRLRTISLTAALAALVLVPAASAHITLNPSEAAAGSFVELAVRVPNEQEGANTVKLAVKLPEGFVSASYEPVPGWTVEVKKKKLATPVETDDGPVSEEISEMIWTGDGDAGTIAPGQFMDFPISVQIPGSAGDTLTFPSLQRYDNGEVVRWIGPPDSDEPAPRVTVTAGGEQTAAPSVESTGSGDGGRDGLTLGLSIAGLVAGVVAIGVVLVSRPRRP